MYGIIKNTPLLISPPVPLQGPQLMCLHPHHILHQLDVQLYQFSYVFLPEPTITDIASFFFSSKLKIHFPNEHYNTSKKSNIQISLLLPLHRQHVRKNISRRHERDSLTNGRSENVKFLTNWNLHLF